MNNTIDEIPGSNPRIRTYLVGSRTFIATALGMSSGWKLTEEFPASRTFCVRCVCYLWMDPAQLMRDYLEVESSTAKNTPSR